MQLCGYVAMSLGVVCLFRSGGLHLPLGVVCILHLGGLHLPLGWFASSAWVFCIFCLGNRHHPSTYRFPALRQFLMIFLESKNCLAHSRSILLLLCDSLANGVGHLSRS